MYGQASGEERSASGEAAGAKRVPVVSVPAPDAAGTGDRQEKGHSSRGGRASGLVWACPRYSVWYVTDERPEAAGLPFPGLLPAEMPGAGRAL